MKLALVEEEHEGGGVEVEAEQDLLSELILVEVELEVEDARE